MEEKKEKFIGQPQPPMNWVSCSNISNELIANKFIVFKTPLHRKFSPDISVEDRFLPSNVFQISHKMNLKIGLWMDLTNHSHFYNRISITEKYDCIYYKLKCCAYRKIPEQTMVEQFNERIKLFILQNPDKHIAVHCSLGFNVTGYMIVCYLVEEEEYTLDDALDLFANARPPGVYKYLFLYTLYEKYYNVQNLRIVKPPHWAKVPGTNDVDELTSSFNIIDKECQASIKEVPEVKALTQMTKVTDLKAKVHKYCNWDLKYYKNTCPGTYPVNLSKDNVHVLNKEDYKVTYKCVGNRYVMLIDGEDECYLFDDNFKIFHVKDIRFPKSNNAMNHLKNTLIDGVMVICKYNDKEIPTYIIHDVVYLRGKDIGKEPQPNRIQLIYDEIISPREELIRTGKINTKKESFVIGIQKYYRIQKTKRLLTDKFKASLSHEMEGLVFVPNKQYIFGRNDKSFKWKPNEEIQLKFKLKIGYYVSNALKCKIGELYVDKQEPLFAIMDYSKKLKNLHEKIISCRFIEGSWKFVTAHMDETIPDSISVAKSVYKVIQNNISKDKLIEYIAKVTEEI